MIRDGTGLISGMTVTVIPERMLGSPALKVFEDAHGKSLRILTSEERGQRCRQPQRFWDSPELG